VVEKVENISASLSIAYWFQPVRRDVLLIGQLMSLSYQVFFDTFHVEKQSSTENARFEFVSVAAPRGGTGVAAPLGFAKKKKKIENLSLKCL
jgi:hypothetical protein